MRSRTIYNVLSSHQSSLWSYNLVRCTKLHPHEIHRTLRINVQKKILYPPVFFQFEPIRTQQHYQQNTGDWRIWTATHRLPLAHCKIRKILWPKLEDLWTVFEGEIWDCKLPGKKSSKQKDRSGSKMPPQE